MRRHPKFICCLLVAWLFCAVTYGGCGGSDNMASISYPTSGDVAPTPTSGDTSGRGDGWEVLDDLGYLEGLVNTWKITDVTMEAYGQRYDYRYIVSSGMIGSTFKMNVSNPKEVWGGGSVLEENEGTVNVGNYGLWCMFRIGDEIADVELIPNNTVFQSIHNGMNLSYQTQPDANGSYCVIVNEDYGATSHASNLTVYYTQYNREEWPYTLTVVTKLEAVY